MLSLWISAERFYATIVPIIFTLLVFLSIFYFIAIFYTQKKTRPRKIAHLSFFSLLLISTLYGIWGHNAYGFWIEQSDYINPGIRTQRVVLGRDVYEDAGMVNMHKNSSSLAGRLSQLDIYESETVKEELPYTYLGSREPSHFFAFGEEDQYFFRIIGEVNWTENEREIVGRQFQLKDDEFESIGFQNDYAILLESISLPKEEQKELEGSINSHNLLPVNDMFPGWTFYNP